MVKNKVMKKNKTPMMMGHEPVAKMKYASPMKAKHGESPMKAKHGKSPIKAEHSKSPMKMDKSPIMRHCFGARK